ncbi:hypothetical protein [Cognatiluteimonas profundi]|uniref:hypothetical protein n=1 Tax=Cognatiluteimonas profundi TaxID=2594501 RepID=UPI00131D0388|nr:hypothetical protein [Lysobacter profundi]
MLGLDIMARSISETAIADKFGNVWQYHSQSDRHSKIACWAIMFDLLKHCPLLRQHVVAGKVGFGINHEMRDFQTSRKKVLDLVVCTPRKAGDARLNKTFSQLAEECGIHLTPAEQADLDDLPEVPVVAVGNVNIALEAKATMTAHIKALPRLHDELDSSHQTIHGDTDAAIAAALVTINASGEFLSTSNNKHSISEQPAKWNVEPQPKAADRTVAKVREIRRRSKPGDQGFDAVGIVLVDFRNDGSPCTIWTKPPAPTSSDGDNYANMIGRIATLYASKFAAF